MPNVILTKKAIKDLDKLSSRDQQRILIHLQKLNIPLPKSLDIKPLTGVSGYLRLRLGSMRVIFEVDTYKQEIWIRAVGYRGNIYGKL